MHQHIKIGKIVATFGVAGQVILVHNLGKKSLFKNVEALFIEESKNSFLPYFVKEINLFDLLSVRKSGVLDAVVLRGVVRVDERAGRARTDRIHW